jgi:hypothetical protein
MTDQRPGATAEAAVAPHPALQVHPHPIRWDIEQQLWVCSRGCGFTRPKREGEIVPSREDAHEEARRAGTGIDFSDLKGRAPLPGQEPRTDDQPPASVPGG